MDDKKFKVEGSGKRGGRPFHRQNFKKNEPMFKAPTVGLETIIFSYRHPKDAAAFIKSNLVLYRYVSINFKFGGTVAARVILSGTDPYLKLLEDPR